MPLTTLQRHSAHVLSALICVSFVSGCAPGANTETTPPKQDAPTAATYPIALPEANGVTEQEVVITMDDGIRLVASEYRPDVPEKVPTVVAFYPYGRKADIAGDHFSFPAEFGYAKLTVDVRGTGASEGAWTIYGEREIADYAQVLEWALQQPYNDGTLVLMGVSSGAISALLAAQHPDAHQSVKAVYARTSHADAFRDLINSGGTVNSSFLAAWAGGLIGVPSLYQPLLSGSSTEPEIVLNATSNHLLGSLPNVASGLLAPLFGSYQSQVPMMQSIPDAAYDGPWYRTRSPIVGMDRIRIPTMLMGANYDLFQRTQPVLYEALNLPPDQKKLISVGGWHFFGPNHLSADDGSRLVLDHEGRPVPSDKVLRVAWFDHWAKGKQNHIDTIPTVWQAYLGEDKFRAQTTALPPRQAKRLHLGTGGTLTESAGAAGQSQVVFQPATGACGRNSVQNIGGRDFAPTGDDLETPCTSDSRINELDGVSFTTAPVEAPTRIAGPGNLQLWIESTRPETHLVAYVSVITADGQSRQISYGSLAGSHRAVTDTACDRLVLDCSVYLDGELLQPWHPYTKSEQTPMVEGTTTRVDIEMMPMFAALAVGERLRVTIKSGDFPKMIPTLSMMEEAAGGITTIRFDQDHPSALIIGQAEQ